MLDDILDTGRTLDAVMGKLREQGATEVKTCVLLTKDIERDITLEADFSGFVIGGEFVVGYGLDYQGKYRNLPTWGFSRNLRLKQKPICQGPKIDFKTEK